MKYKITIYQTVYQRAYFTVEAPSACDAAVEARKIYEVGPPLEWLIDDCDDLDIDAQEVENEDEPQDQTGS